MTNNEDIEEHLLQVIADRLGVSRGVVVTCGEAGLVWHEGGHATVLVHLPSAGVPPLTVEVIEAGGGAVLRGWPDSWPAGQVHGARQALMEHQQCPRLAVPVVSALKDLGVVIGSGPQGRSQHQQRLCELVRRASLIAQVGATFKRKERLVAGSALPAGLYGCASQPPDADTFEAIRRHVLFALHRGSRFCQASLFFTFAIGAWRADPAAVWICKAVEAARAIGSAFGRGVVLAIAAKRCGAPAMDSSRPCSGLGLV